MLEELIKKNRSFRQFDENVKIAKETLESFVNMARLSASAANLQPLKYIFSCDKEKNNEIFKYLSWAAYIKNWRGPKEGKRPAAYIIILQDTKISQNKWAAYDCGIAAQSILLAAAGKDFGGCMIGSIDKKRLKAFLSIEEHLEIMLVVAIGKPIEKVMTEEIAEGESIKYYRDEKGIHHVPKRKLKSIIIK